MKIDIVDLMDFYCNDVPVPDALEGSEELPEQGWTRLTRRETGRRWKRPLLAAGVMLLAVLVMVPFALSRTTGEHAAENADIAQSAEAPDDYQTAYPDGDPAAASAENAQPAEASDDYQTAHLTGLLLPSAVYPVALEVPAEYVEEIEVDTPFLDIRFETIQFDNVVFSFYDKSSQKYGWPGLVWCITATPKNEYTPLDPAEYDYIYAYNRTELGADADYVYELIYPMAECQYIKNDPENAESYFAHIAVGQDLLTQFIQQNSLQSDGAGVERYTAYLASLDDQTAYPDSSPSAASADNAQSAEVSNADQTAHLAGTLFPSAVYPVALEVPAEYTAEIVVDTPFQDTSWDLQYDNTVFSFYDKYSQKYDRIGLVWCITATPKDEYTPLDPINYDFIFEYNQTELGRDEDYVYTLIYPRVSHQCNSNDPENVESYFTHIAIGQDLLTQFIQQNSLRSDGIGVERYAAFLALQKKQVQ